MGVMMKQTDGYLQMRRSRKVPTRNWRRCRHPSSQQAESHKTGWIADVGCSIKEDESRSVGGSKRSILDR